jgi:hypothetical protein
MILGRGSFKSVRPGLCLARERRVSGLENSRVKVSGQPHTVNKRIQPESNTCT